MAKRKPPSLRPERQMDEAAKAIAQSREAAKGEKSKDAQKAADAKPGVGRPSMGISSRKVVAPPAFPSTKRPKKG